MSELVALSAADDAALLREIERLVAYLDRVGDAPLADIAYTAALSHGPSVLAVIAQSAQDLRERCASAAKRLASGTAKRLRDKSGTYYFREHLLGPGGGKLAFVFPGVQSFYPDMIRDLAITYPECRGAFDELEEAMVGVNDFTPSSFIFPPAPCYRRDADIFRSGAYAQALVSTYSACAALSRLLRRAGIAPSGVVGLAGGDLAAMMRSGAAGSEPPRPDRIRVLNEIYHVVDTAIAHAGLPESVTLAVILHHAGEIDDVVATFPPERFMLAVNLSPRQKTFAVAPDFADEATRALTATGARVMRLGLNRPFNTPLSAALVPYIRKFATGWMKHETVYDIYSCATAARLADGLRPAREDTAERWARPALFQETVERMYADGYRVFLEVGPRGLMTRAVEDTLREFPHAAIAMNSIHRSGALQAQHAIAQLMALGAEVDLTSFFSGRPVRRLDFDAALPTEVRRDAERRLSRRFPRLTFLSGATVPTTRTVLAAPSGRGARATARAVAVANLARRQRQFDFGAFNPLVSDADTLQSSPGVSTELTKVFRIADMPFIGDFALGTSQISYSDPNLRGLVTLTIPVGAELMAETAQSVIQNRVLVRIENFNCRRMVPFVRGTLKVFVRAERIPSGNAAEVAVKVLVRDDAPDSAYTWPVMEAVFVFAAAAPGNCPVAVEPLLKPRSVHWSGRDIYPSRICFGRRLRCITFAENWSETGLDYTVRVPPLADNVAFTRFPMWVVNPVFFGAVASGFALWRSHEKFTGAFSFPVRFRRIVFRSVVPKEGSDVKCYLRLTGVTPKSHLCDIAVTDGNGKEILSVAGWEELTERVPVGYRDLILQPVASFLSEPLSPEALGHPAVEAASAALSDIPYPIFERNEELWLKTLSHVILNAEERRAFGEMTSSAARRTEWLFGRVAAKEAIRRFMRDYYQARWSDADVHIWADDSGKPHAIGAWADYLAGRVDIAIAHTTNFIVAVAAANARVGVDVEFLGRDLSEEFTFGVFTPEELEIAAQAVNAAQAILRFWCAKEAVSKALGTGIRYSPKEMNVVAYDADAGRIEIRLNGAWATAFKGLKGRNIPVSVHTMRDHALAVCFIPAAFFAEGLVENAVPPPPEPK